MAKRMRRQEYLERRQRQKELSAAQFSSQPKYEPVVPDEAFAKVAALDAWLNEPIVLNIQEDA